MLNYDSPHEIGLQLEQLGIRLQKRWGQNFLINRGARQRIVSLLEPEAQDSVWEIGPGLGALTVLLLPRVKSLTAFEIDRGLIRFLDGQFAEQGNLRITAGDVLKTWKAQAREHGLPDRITGNLPYSSASALIGALAEERVMVARMVFTVQRELARRMTASPGSKSYSSFSVLCQSAYRIESCLELKPGSFFPPPEVISTVVRLTPNPEAGRDGREEWAFFLRLLRLLFASRRKTIRNNLMAAALLPGQEGDRLSELVRQLGIDPGWRAERLPVPQLRQLARSLYQQLKDL